MSAPILTVDGLTVDYTTHEGSRRAVDGVSLEIAAGEVLGVVGESGSGKSTIAQTIIGLQAANARIVGGSVKLGDLDLLAAGRRTWRQVRGTRIALVPQDPNNSLNPLRTVGASIAEPLLLHGASPKAVQGRVLELLELVGIPDPPRRAAQYPHELSGGMRQRVLIAAAVALEPELIIADEPTSALDVTVQRRILDLIDELRLRTNTSVLLITHDVGVAGERADRLLVMRRGRMEEVGPTARVITSPERDYTRQLISDVPSFSVRTRETIIVPESTAPLVEVTGLVREFSRGRQDEPFRAVDDVSFTVAPGTTHAIVGESGSGKTTTGRILVGLDHPTAGTVRVGDREIRSVRGARAREQRRAVQLVYQNPFGSLDPRQHVGSIIEEPLRNFRIGGKYDLANPKDKAFRLQYAKAYKLQPDVYAVQGYDAAQMLAAGVNAVKGDMKQRDALVKAIESAKIDSPRGAFTLSRAHNPVQDIYLREVSGKVNRNVGIAVKGLADPARGCRL